MYLKVDCNRRGLTTLFHIKHRKYNHIEFIQIMSGDGSVIAGTNILPMVKGAVYIIDSSIPHCTAPTDSEDYVRNCITVDRPSFERLMRAASANDVMDTLDTDSVYCSLPDAGTAEAISRDFATLATFMTDKSDEATKCHALLGLVLKMRPSSKRPGDLSPKKSIAAAALKYIERYGLTRISTEELARELHISKYHLCHSFKQRTGMTLTEYILDKRLSVAYSLLDDSTLSVSQISAMSGFSSESYFIMKFKERYGISPGKMRSE